MSDGDVAAARVSGPELLETGDRRTVLARLMSEHGDTVYGLCIRILRDQTLAEDVLQQVFVEAYRDLQRFEGRSTMKTWLLAIAGHRCQDAIKARRRRDKRFLTDENAVANVADPTPDAHSRLDHARSMQALEDCIATLSAESRTAVLLRFQAGMSYEEMSAALVAKADTLHARVTRAMPVLRRCLEAKGWIGERL
jgi:RNA polymerase sigma-70 factor (ECF subfamily)